MELPQGAASSSVKNFDAVIALVVVLRFVGLVVVVAVVAPATAAATSPLTTTTPTTTTIAIRS